MATQDRPSQTRSDGDSGKTSAAPSETSRQPGDRERNIQRSQDTQRSAISRPVGGVQGRATPFALMRRMTEDMERFLDHFGFGRFGTGLLPRLSAFDDDLWTLAAATETAAWLPQVEMFQRGDKLVVRADLPGLGKDDVNVEVQQGTVTISGERKDEHEENREGYYRSERSYGRFYRTIQLPEGVDEQQCDATFRNGVLELEFNAPRQEIRTARRIQIR